MSMDYMAVVAVCVKRTEEHEEKIDELDDNGIRSFGDHWGGQGMHIGIALAESDDTDDPASLPNSHDFEEATKKVRELCGGEPAPMLIVNIS